MDTDRKNKRLNTRLNKKTGWMLSCCTLLLLAGCTGNPQVESSPKPETTLNPSPSIHSTPTPDPAKALSAYTYPLTGVPLSQEAYAQYALKLVERPANLLLPFDRPRLVTVENSPQARPQSGLNKADIVFEVLAEGEITRFLAIYHSQKVETIGPVRSMRPYFAHLGEGLDAVLVHAGWSQDAMNYMESRKLNHLDQVYGDDKYYWRAKDRKMPHNLYTSTDLMAQGSQERKFRGLWKAPELHFAKGQGVNLLRDPGSTITIPYISGYKVAYTYDAGRKQYMRTMAGKPHLDKETNEQLSTTNLLIIEAEHQILDKEGRRSVNVNGPGRGVIMQEGKSQPITWDRKGGMIRAYADGSEIPLLAGTTWVQIVPPGTKLDIK
ncbi:DUF3048 domain-containing protein [Paenibacillus sp. N1-5-1-14]|uniref:DUF3048 domain-containing protein n=1 Tax=Paenibacillus radicibacter TaxID=2972488 RepID=UPI0021595198|nr:DUF3048 domain-containing protein [Paenibacillus radicibacter]MCR8644553.1 DUF3048 domain-containing protein [Paenibacillus radicibacter]